MASPATNAGGVSDPFQNIFLVGPMGAGKSTLGRYLSERTGRAFFDSDKVIEERTGADIPWIFDMEGEAGFRRREEEIIDELTQKQGIILATGGGAILREANRHHLRDRGTVFYLYTPVEVQVERTRQDRNRPLLQNTDAPEELLADLLDTRDPLYRSIAHYVVSTEAGNLRKVAGQVLACMGLVAEG